MPHSLELRCHACRWSLHYPARGRKISTESPNKAQENAGWRFQIVRESSWLFRVAGPVSLIWAVLRIGVQCVANQFCIVGFKAFAHGLVLRFVVLPSDHGGLRRIHHCFREATVTRLRPVHHLVLIRRTRRCTRNCRWRFRFDAFGFTHRF